MKSNDIKLTVLFDNECCNNDLTSLWGFSCFIQTTNSTILFDTGSNGRVLLKNIEKKKLKIPSIDNIFLSHAHWDHIGGIDSILELNSSVHIFVTSHISKNFIRDMKTLSNGVTIIEEKPTEILTDIYSTGYIGEQSEQSIILNTDDGLIIIAGCAHGGIENIAKRAKKFFNKKILLLLGGFHLHSKNDQEILKIIKTIKNLDTKFVAPSHCTGSRARELFKEEFKDNYIDSGLGIEISFKENDIINYCF
ncbi:MAG: MBL fold metallo-hydrolase [Epsilonproteobacteria bacterium]|nr:MBL fold metallo-hydrolase [Campylobacterota bacterium]